MPFSLSDSSKPKRIPPVDPISLLSPRQMSVQTAARRLSEANDTCLLTRLLGTAWILQPMKKTEDVGHVGQAMRAALFCRCVPQPCSFLETWQRLSILMHGCERRSFVAPGPGKARIELDRAVVA